MTFEDWLEEYPMPESFYSMSEDDRDLWIETLIDSFGAGYSKCFETMLENGWRRGRLKR